MKKIFIALIAGVFAVSGFAATPIVTTTEMDHVVNIAKEPPVSVQFKRGNYFRITSQFNETLMNNFVEKVMVYQDKDLILYFDSPGGSVISLARMVGTMKASKLNFICVARFAASAAFTLFQYCTKRYILNDGVIMQHNWSGTFGGEAPRIKSLFNAVDKLVRNMDGPVIKRLKLTPKEYYTKINNNLWMTGADAVTQYAADVVINNISCSRSLVKSRHIVNKTVRTMFGLRTIKQKISGCPLLDKTYPLKSKNSDEDDDNF